MVSAILNEFYKKECQEKTSPSTGGEDFSFDIQPTVCKYPRFSSRDFALACVSFLWVSCFGGDDANRVLKLGKRTWSWNANHGSIVQAEAQDLLQSDRNGRQQGIT